MKIETKKMKTENKKITKEAFKAALKESSRRGFGDSDAARQGCVAVA